MSDAIKPQPAGTLEELKQYGLDPGQVGSCAERIQGKVLGCPHYEHCIFGRKGPQNYAIRLMLHDGGFNEVSMPCFDAMYFERNFNRNEHSRDMMEVITDKEHPNGGPGTPYIAKGTKPQEFIEDGKKYTKHVPHKYPRKVELFPKISQNVDLVGEAYSSEARERMIKQRREKKIMERHGISDADLDIDNAPEGEDAT